MSIFASKAAESNIDERTSSSKLRPSLGHTAEVGVCFWLLIPSKFQNPNQNTKVKTNMLCTGLVVSSEYDVGLRTGPSYNLQSQVCVA